jgi:SAM-dependent methyltransferase
MTYYDARWGYRKVDAHRYERRRYGGRRRWLNQRFLERALARALAGVPRGGLVLDAPCGTGRLFPVLHRLGYRTVGADIGHAMLEVARGRAHGLGLLRADLEHPPLRAGSVDAVVSSRFVMLLPPHIRPAVLRGMAELTHGPLVVTVCHPYTFKHLFRVLRRALGSTTKRSPRLTGRALRADIRAAGLELERLIAVAPMFSEVWVVVLRRP